MRILATMTIVCAVLCSGCATHDPAGNIRSARLSNYAGMARSELGKMHCDRDFRFVSSADGEEVYQATCTSGTTQLLECDGVACRPVK